MRGLGDRPERVKDVIALIPINSTVILQTSRLGYRLNSSTGIASKFGLVAAALHLDLGDGVNADKRIEIGAVGVLNGHSVNGDVVLTYA